MATAAISRGWVKTADGLEPTDPRMQQIVFQIRAGRPTYLIAEQFNVTSSRVSRIARKIGAPDRRRKRESSS